MQNERYTLWPHSSLFGEGFVTVRGVVSTTPPIVIFGTTGHQMPYGTFVPRPFPNALRAFVNLSLRSFGAHVQ
jgi:hypothetical protein